MRTELFGALLAFGLLVSVALPATTFRSGPATAFVYPLMSPRLASTFGDRKHPVLHYVKHHNGVDLAAPQGAQIRAVAEGTVVFADPYAGYGKLVVIEHANGTTTHYGHCSEFKVRPGQKVVAGQIVALVGSTGMVTGPHLHFEIRNNGVPRNPEEVFPGLALEAQG